MIYKVFGKEVSREAALKACIPHTNEDHPIELFEALFRNAEKLSGMWAEDACWAVQGLTDHDVCLFREVEAA